MKRTQPVVTRAASPLGIVFTTVLVDLLGFGIVLPLLPFYAYQFRASAFLAGVLVASYSAMQFVFAPLWGELSDRIGRRPVMLVSLAGSTISYGLFALADGVGLLLFSRLLAGVAGANIPVAQAIVADTTTETNRARGMGMIGAAFGLGFIFGPAVGGFLAQYGHRAPGGVAAVICGLNFLAAVWRLPETRPSRGAPPLRTRPHRVQRLARAARDPRRRALMLLFAAAVFAFAAMEATLSLLCATVLQLEPSRIYWLFGFLGVVNSAAQGGLVGRLSRRYGEAVLAIVGAALLAVGLAAIPHTRPWGTLLASLAALALGQGMTSPSLLSLLSQSGSPEDRGVVLGASQSLSSLARILGPLWGGFAFQHFGPAAPYASTAGLLVLVLAGAFRALPPERRPPESPALRRRPGAP